MDGASEGAHMNHPDFRVGGRIFATIHRGDEHGMVKLSPGAQRRFVREHPGAFAPEAGAWGLQGCTRVYFARADEEAVGEAMTLAWRLACEPGGRRRPRPKK
ncbi:MAG: MmcQ/YjbR family DNA-binding protein [Betaproteobacteria bacterium]